MKHAHSMNRWETDGKKETYELIHISQQTPKYLHSPSTSLALANKHSTFTQTGQSKHTNTHTHTHTYAHTLT